MYEQGMRAYFRGEIQTAHAFFTGAVAEDSLFALATFQNAITGAAELDSVAARLERAKRLAARAPDRERLTILAKWAYSVCVANAQATRRNTCHAVPHGNRGASVHGHQSLL